MRKKRGAKFSSLGVLLVEKQREGRRECRKGGRRGGGRSWGVHEQSHDVCSYGSERKRGSTSSASGVG